MSDEPKKPTWKEKYLELEEKFKALKKESDSKSECLLMKIEKLQEQVERLSVTSLF